MVRVVEVGAAARIAGRCRIAARGALKWVTKQWHRGLNTGLREADAQMQGLGGFFALQRFGYLQRKFCDIKTPRFVPSPP